MNRIVHNLILDMKSIIVQQTIDVQRYDTGRKFEITLSDNGKIYQIGEGCIAVFTATKPDGSILYNHCEIVDNTIVFDLLKNPQATAVEGEVKCEIRVYGADGALITSPRFDIVVDKTLYSDDSIESSSEFSALTQAIVANINAVNAANEAVAKAQADIEKAVEEAEATVDKAVAKAESDVDEAVADMRTIVDDSANAFKGKVRGNIVSMEDVSSIEHTANVKVKSKNLIARKYHSPSQTTSGVTFTINDDGSVTVNGTAEAKVIFYFQSYNTKLKLTKGESYVLSGCPGTGSSTTYMIQGTDGTIYYTDIGIGKQFVAKGEDFYFYIVVYEGFTANNLVFKPQLEVGEVATEFTPYVDPATITLSVKDASGETVATYTPNSDGTVDGVKSISPRMTLSTDTENAIIEVEYNRDSNVVIQELYDYINSAPVARIVDVTLPASKWVGSGNLYSQVVNIEGITERSQVDLTPSVEQLSIFYNKDLAFVTENEDGIVTVYSIGQKPMNDYTIQATVTEVNV